MDVHKHFAAKYGKEFISAAVELRPDCGVGRMLIEKLSVKAPDGPAKIKILKSIAEEHNIKWDPSIENDPKPHEDFLNGPSSFEKASQMHMDPPNVQVRPNYDERGQSSFQVPYSHAEKYNMPANLHDKNRSSVQYSQDSAPTGVVAKTSTISDTSRPEVRPPGSGNKDMDFRHSYPGNGRDFSSSRQNWNMEFKDAAEAAQAAAESAERASMAARAAAELSSRENIIRQYSSESHNSSAYGLKGDKPERYADSRFEDKHLPKDQLNDSINRKVPHIQNEQDNQSSGVDERSYKNDNKSTNNSSWPSSVDDPVVNSSIMTDNSFGLERSDLTGRMNFRTQSSKSSFKSATEEQDDSKSENIDYSAEVRIRKQSSRSCSPSHSRILSDDHNVVMDPNRDAGENPFAVTDEGSIQSDTKQTSSHDKASLVFDESGSDDYEDVFDAVGKGKGQESSLFFSSPGRRSPTHLSTNISAWSPMQNVPDPVFSADSAIASQSDNLLPVTFDDSDGPSSECAEELDNSKHDGRIEPGTFMSKHNSSFVEKGSESDIRVLSQSFANDMDSREVHPDGNQGMESSSNIQEKFSISDFPSKLKRSQVVSDDNDSDSSNDPVVEGNSRRAQQLSRPSLVHEELKDNFLASELPGTLRDTDHVKESSLDSGSELNLGMLTGGLRNKKSYRHPPYRNNPSGKALFPKQAVGDTPSTIEQSSSSSRVKTTVGFGASLREVDNLNSRTKINEKSSSVASHAHLDNDSDEEVPKQMYSSSQELHNNSLSIEVNKKSTSRSPPTYFDSDNSDSEEDHVRLSSARKARSGTGLSRRTKASTARSDRHSPMKTTVPSESQGTSNRRAETAENLSEPHSVTESSFHIGDLDWARKVAEPVSKPIPDSNRSLPKQRKEAEPVPNPIPDRNRPSPVERKEAEPVSKPIPNRNSPSPIEREVTEPVTKPIPDLNRLSSEERLKSAAREQSSNSHRKIVLSGTSGSLKTSSLSAAESPSKEKHSHVHPNLPDIDSLTAHLQSLRNNR